MVRRPSAEVMPGYTGTITSGISSMAATSAPWSGPAPPNATSEKPRGSMPFWIVRERMALAMLLLRMVRTPSAAATSSRPRRPASSAMARRAADRSSFISPPRKLSLSRRPSTRLASVTVASVPPRP